MKYDAAFCADFTTLCWYFYKCFKRFFSIADRDLVFRLMLMWRWTGSRKSHKKKKKKSTLNHLCFLKMIKEMLQDWESRKLLQRQIWGSHVRKWEIKNRIPENRHSTIVLFFPANSFHKNSTITSPNSYLTWKADWCFLTGHAEVFGLLGLMTTFGAGWSFSFLLFVNLTLGMLIAETGLPKIQHIKINVTKSAGLVVSFGAKLICFLFFYLWQQPNWTFIWINLNISTEIRNCPDCDWTHHFHILYSCTKREIFCFEWQPSQSSCISLNSSLRVVYLDAFSF